MLQVKGALIPMDQLGRQFQLLECLDGFFVAEYFIGRGGRQFLFECNLARSELSNKFHKPNSMKRPYPCVNIFVTSVSNKGMALNLSVR